MDDKDMGVKALIQTDLKEIHTRMMRTKEKLERAEAVQHEDIAVFELIRQDAETLYYLARLLSKEKAE